VSNPYRDKLLSINVAPSAFESRTKVNYYDADALATVFPEDAAEQMAEETEGRGAMSSVNASPDDLAFYAGGREVDDV
jgi:hypothetical protein